MLRSAPPLFSLSFLGAFLVVFGSLVPVPVEAQVFTGPCSRRTSVVLSEIHYHPAGDTDGSGEFIELYNSSPISVDLSGWKLRGDVDYDFPDGIRLRGGEFLVIAASPDDLAGTLGEILGPWSGTLSNNNGTVRLQKASGGIVLETSYRDNECWPLAADGAGHSLVLAQPSYGESRPEAWKASRSPGGSPGRLDPVSQTPLDDLVISEVLTDGDDFVELYNAGTQPVDLAGIRLSNDPDDAGYTIPSGMLPSGQYRFFPAGVLGFSFDALGDEIYLRAPDGRVLQARKLRGQEDNRSHGGITRWSELSNPTPGMRNAPRFQHPVVINEIHYHPAGGNTSGEFIELFNRGPNEVDLTGWTLRGGVRFTFPEDATLPSGHYFVIANDRANLLSLHPDLSPTRVLGDFSGSLSNRSERIELRNVNQVTIDEVTYFEGGRWPERPDGGGGTLQLIDPDADNALAPNWLSGDESAASRMVTLEHTGVLDLGHQKAPQATRVFLLLAGRGEVIIDDVEVLVNGENVVTNGGFESGTAGWQMFGTHSSSFANNGTLHLVATDDGDHANLVETTLTSPIAPGTTVTLRATCRWVSGDPDILLGLNGGWLEAAGTLSVPEAVGTPGAANASNGNAGPAITEVNHSPLLPQVGEPITVTARVDDPDGVAAVRLRYRFDPANSVQQVTMTHQGEGIYSGVIPPQTSPHLVAFFIQTIDSASPGVITRFPADAPDRECLVKIGEVTPPGDFSTMRIWITEDTLVEWRDRNRSSNRKLDATFVSDSRVFYNAGVHYAGSQNGVTIYDSPVGNPTGYNIALPDDEFFLNVQRLTLDRETTRDATRQRERLLFWFLEKLGLPNLHRRYVHVYLNGIKRNRLIMEDVQKPNRDVMREWFDGGGRLTKTNPWFEFDSANRVNLSNPGPNAIVNRLQHFRTMDGAYKIPRYRWTWSHGAGHEDAHDFSGLFDLIDAAEAPESELVSRMRRKADLRQWMRTFSANDLGSFWDTFGNPGSKNAYLFESRETNRWSVIVWDMDVGLGVFNDPYNAPLFPNNVDGNLQRLYAQPDAIRDYWQALDESLETFFRANPGSEVHEILQETYQILLANGASVTSPFVPSGPDGLSVDTWIDQRRAFLQGELSDKVTNFSVSGPATSKSVFATITGSLPLSVTTITANGFPLMLTHPTVTEWSSRVALQPGGNTLLIEAFDSRGILVGSEALNITYTGNEAWADLKINEWMASNPRSGGFLDPADGEADDWFELYNPTADPVSLQGWAVSDDPSDPFKFIIPSGFVIPANGHLLVWADNESLQNNPAVRQEVHVAFRLFAGGEAIVLTAPDGTRIDLVQFGEQGSGIVERRVPDGGDDFGFSSAPSPGSPNLSGRPESAVVSLSLQGDDPSLSFSTRIGTVYQLEWSLNLADWNSENAPFSGDGSPVLISLRSHPGDRRFYRIVSY